MFFWISMMLKFIASAYVFVILAMDIITIYDLSGKISLLSVIAALFMIYLLYLEAKFVRAYWELGFGIHEKMFGKGKDEDR